jgi:hypothetical protein
MQYIMRSVIELKSYREKVKRCIKHLFLCLLGVQIASCFKFMGLFF